MTELKVLKLGGEIENPEIVYYDCLNPACDFEGKIESHCQPKALVETLRFNCPRCHSKMKRRK